MNIFDGSNWTEGAACIGENPETFFPTGRPGCSGDPRRTEAAKAICARCDIRAICLTKALEEEAAGESHRWGIRGGLDAGERAALVRGNVA